MTYIFGSLDLRNKVYDREGHDESSRYSNCHKVENLMYQVSLLTEATTYTYKRSYPAESQNMPFTESRSRYR